MKIAILSESSADETALRILIEAILGRTTQRTEMSPRSRGWPSVRQILSVVIRDLHYSTDCDAMVVVVDSNGSTTHDANHNPSVAVSSSCRMCQLLNIASRTMTTLRPIPNRTPLKVAIGCAVPAIEAWLCYGLKTGVGEAMWNVELRERPSNTIPVKQDLKRAAYLTDRPSLEVETSCMMQHMQRVVQNLESLEKAFPNGLGILAKEIRSWR